MWCSADPLACAEAGRHLHRGGRVRELHREGVPCSRHFHGLHEAGAPSHHAVHGTSPPPTPSLHHGKHVASAVSPAGGQATLRHRYSSVPGVVSLMLRRYLPQAVRTCT